MYFSSRPNVRNSKNIIIVLLLQQYMYYLGLYLLFYAYQILLDQSPYSCIPDILPVITIR